MSRAPKKRGPGRPKQTDAPSVPVEELEQILVFGEDVVGVDGKRRRVFPTFRELAKRYDVSHSIIASFSARNACMERRRQRYPELEPSKRKASRSSRASSPRAPAPPPSPTPVADIATASAPGGPPPAADDTPAEIERPRGRPRKIDAPRIPYEELDRVLVFGELRQSPDRSGQLVVYPSHAELAERYGVAASLISKYATDHNCKQRREIAQFRVQARVDEKLVELNADTIADVKTELKLMAAEVLRQFRERLREGAVRLDDPSTFNTIGRFLLLLDGQAEGRQEIAVGLSLADLEARHRQVIDDVRRFSPLEAGLEDAQLVAPTPTATTTDPDGDEDDSAVDNVTEDDADEPGGANSPPVSLSVDE